MQNKSIRYDFAWQSHWVGAPERALLTRRWRFLSEMERLLPWSNWLDLIAPYYVKRRVKDGDLYPLNPLLRLHMLQQWFVLSDLDATEMATDSTAARHFMRLPCNVWFPPAPDERALLNFRLMLTRHGLATQIAADQAAALKRQGWEIRPGAIAETWVSER